MWKKFRCFVLPTFSSILALIVSTSIFPSFSHSQTSDGAIQVPLNGFVNDGDTWVWPSISDPVVTVSDTIYDNEVISPVFTSSSIVATLESNNATPGTAFVEFNEDQYSVDISFTTTAVGDKGGAVLCTDQLSGNSVLLDVGETGSVQSTPVNGASPIIVCGMVETNSATLIINSITLTPAQQLSIDPSSVVVTQAVNNFTLSGQSDVTLVQGKNAAITATVNVTNPIANDQTPMTVTVTMPDGTTATSSPIPMAKIDPDDGVEVTLVPVAVNSSGQGTISLQATASDATSSESTSETVVVKATNQLGIVYSSLYGSSFGQVAVTDAATHELESDQFIQGAFPVAEGGVVPVSGGDISGTPVVPLSAAAILDIANLWLERTIVHPSARNAIAIVPSGYFTYHGDPDVRGITLLSSASNLGLPSLVPAASLVQEGYWTTTAHEIGHTFGLVDLSDPPLVDGFWVDQNEKFSDSSNDLMGDATSIQLDTLGTSNLPGAWLSSSEYSTIFQGLLVNPSDPQVMVVSGVLGNDGSVQLQPTYFLSNGVSTPYSASADGVVNALGFDGSIVAQASFQSSFNLVTDTGVQIPTNSTAFLVQIPFSQGTETIQINRSGKVLTTINPNSQLLIDAIQEIPSTRFIKNAAREERGLLNQAKRIESVLDLCSKIQSDKDHDNWSKIACTDGAEELVLALRAKVDKDLNDSTTTTSPFQMTKSGVLKTVDFVALQLLGSPTIQAGGRAVVIKILPDSNKGVLSISSVTQGKYGSVYINPNGSITYKPNSGKPEADSFTVTIQDIDGASVVKTVSIVLPCLDESSLSRWGNRFF